MVNVGILRESQLMINAVGYRQVNFWCRRFRSLRAKSKNLKCFTVREVLHRIRRGMQSQSDEGEKYAGKTSRLLRRFPSGQLPWIHQSPQNQLRDEISRKSCKFGEFNSQFLLSYVQRSNRDQHFCRRPPPV